MRRLALCLEGLPSILSCLKQVFGVRGDRECDVAVKTAISAALVAALAGRASAQLTEPFPPDFELSTLLPMNGGDGTLGFSIAGIGVDDRSGVSVSSAGDLNGDGIGDIIIKAYGFPGGANEGDSYVVFGGAGVGSAGPIELSSLDGTNGFVLNGIGEAFVEGDSVSSAGDVNGDGFDDVIIGSQRSGPGAVIGDGKTFVVFGGPGIGSAGSVNLSLLDGSDGFVINGVDYSGSFASGAGDVNGDGVDDIVLGARFGNAGTGEVYVVFGGVNVGETGALELDALDGSDGFVLRGSEFGVYAGRCVSSAGDVNGDGFGDIVIGAYNARPNGRGSGQSYVVFGGGDVGSTGVFELAALDGSNGFVVNGIENDDRSGISVSAAGDLNGDGFGDVAIGAYFADPNGYSAAGEAYVVFGGADVGATGAVELSSLCGPTGFRLYGAGAGHSAGTVSRGGDVNSDGFDDLLVGAYRANVSYVIFGGSEVGETGLIELSALDGIKGVAIRGAAAGHQSGRSLSAAGDVNNDGIDDIIIGAIQASPNGGRSGESYVVFGRLPQVWDREHGGVFELGGNWLSGVSPTSGSVFIEPALGGVVSLAEPGELALTSLRLGSERAVARLDIGMASLIGIDLPLWLPKSAQISGSGILVAEAGVTSRGLLTGDGLSVFTTAGVVNRGVVTGPDLYIESSVGVTNQGLVAVRGQSADDVSVVSVFGTLTNEPSGEVLLEQGAVELVAGAVVNGGEILVSDTRATIVGDLINDLAVTSTVGLRLGGVNEYDATGQSVSSAGDMNGDGFDDIIVSAYRADPFGASSAGESYVVFGGADLASIGSFDLSLLDGRNGFVMNGVDGGDHSGGAVASAGDVNGDGFGDIIIGAYQANPNGIANAGESYVVFGGDDVGSSGSIKLALLDGTNGFVFNGIDANDVSGKAVASAGDVNADGMDDLIIGAPGRFPSRIAGEAYVVFGDANIGSSAAFELSSLDGSNGFVIDGVDPFDFAGISLSAAGDLNGDGIDDLVLGAPVARPNDIASAGESYVIFGRVGLGSSGAVDLSALDGANGFVLNGIDDTDLSGRAVSSAGDVNGDGFDDLVIGAYRADPNGDFSGESYVIFGAASVGSSGTLDLSSLDGSNGFYVNGVDAEDRSGRFVSSAGDLNGDGFNDIVIAAFEADPNGSESGETYVLFGGTGIGSDGGVERSALNAEDGFIVNGIAAEDRSGCSVASAGDVDGDGTSDLLVGARGADPSGRVDAGEAYVIFGRRATDEPFAPVIELSELDMPFEADVSGRVVVSGSSTLTFAGNISSTGSMLLHSDSEIRALGEFSGNGVSGPAGPGSAGSVLAFDRVLPNGPGLTGVMAFEGELYLLSTSHVVIDIGGPSPGAGHDQIAVAGEFGVAGSAVVELTNSFVPLAGSRFELVTFGSRVGEFSSLELPDVPGLEWAIEYGASSLSIVAEVNGCSPADVTTDGTGNGVPDGSVTLSDFSFYLTLWSSSNSRADLTTDGTSNGLPDGAVTLSDFSYYLGIWSAGCP